MWPPSDPFSSKGPGRGGVSPPSTLRGRGDPAPTGPPADTTTTPNELAAAHAAPAAALVAGASPPARFDAAALAGARASLARKRESEVACAWPALAAALGERYPEEFARFASRRPLPREGGPLADGRAFAAELLAAGKLPDAARAEALAVDLRFV